VNGRVLAAAALAAVAALSSACGADRAPLVPVPPASVPLSGSWRFAVDPTREGVRSRWFRTAYDDGGWKTVTVPHTWNVMPARRDYSGLAWYRRSFALPEREVRNAHLRLRFEAVFYAARIWLNGHELGRHEGGYTPFELDATTAARAGRNVLAVLVDNHRGGNRIPADITPTWSFDWWNYGGIVRDVSLAVTSRAYLAEQRIVAAPHLTGRDEADAAAVGVAVRVANDSGHELRGTVEAATDGAHGSVSITIAAGSSATARLRLRLERPRLWHVDHPSLYALRTTLRSETGALLDRRGERFGVRSVVLAHGRLLLNGEPVRLVGLSRHEDSPAHGLAETPAVVKRDYDDLKTLNEVLTRPVHYPQSPLVLDYADRHGILLIPEVPAWQLTRDQMANPRMQALERRQLREMIESEANHPSVIAWSIGNELDSQTIEGWRFVKRMIEYVKSLDPTRPVGFVSNQLYDTPQIDATRFSDFVEMNEYFGSWGGPKNGLAAALDRVHAAFPDKPVIVSEYGLEPHWYEFGGSANALDYSHDSEYYYVSESVPDTSALADSERRRLIADQLAVFRPRSWIVAAVFWTYEDYRTDSGYVMGVVDKNRKPRRSWALLRREDAPVVLNAVTAGPSGARIELRARTDLPSYTLRGYTLRWALRSQAGTTLAQGSTRLPDLPPGTRWTGHLRWRRSAGRAALTLNVVRPTGFSAVAALYRIG